MKEKKRNAGILTEGIVAASVLVARKRRIRGMGIMHVCDHVASNGN